jgi:phage I-like protein
VKRSRVAVLAALPLPTGGGAPSEFRILRAGLNRTEKGDFLFDEQAAGDVMRAYTAKGLDRILIDFEHQSMQAPPGGGPAHKAAAGWFAPQIRAGELWATDVTWTTTALSMLAPAQGAPEYRYLSPVLFFDEETRRVTRLKNIALTNDPALDELSPLVAATALEDEMPCAECSAKDSKIKDLEDRFTALTAKLSAFEEKDKEKLSAMTALTGVRDKLVALTGQSTEAAAIGTIEAWKAKAAQTDQLLAERATEQTALLTAEMGRVLEGAVKAGKLPPAMKTFEERGALAFGAGKVTKEGVEYLTAKWGAAPAIVNPGGVGNPSEKKTGTAILTAEDRQIAALMGNDLKDVEAFKTKQLEDRARAGLSI